MLFGRFVTGVCAVALLGGTSCANDVGTQQSDWWLSAVPSGPSLAVVVYVGSSSCSSFDRLDLDETDDDVTITAYINFTGDQACTADSTWQSVPVELSAPLGTRVLLGCTAPQDANRAPDLAHDGVDCRSLIRPETG